MLAGIGQFLTPTEASAADIEDTSYHKIEEMIVYRETGNHRITVDYKDKTPTGLKIIDQLTPLYDLYNTIKKKPGVTWIIPKTQVREIRVASEMREMIQTTIIDMRTMKRIHTSLRPKPNGEIVWGNNNKYHHSDESTYFVLMNPGGRINVSNEQLENVYNTIKEKPGAELPFILNQ
jgi:hypothetical protein